MTFTKLLSILSAVMDISSPLCIPDIKWTRYALTVPPVEFEGKATSGGCSGTNCVGPESRLGDGDHRTTALNVTAVHAWNRTVQIIFNTFRDLSQNDNQLRNVTLIPVQTIESKRFPINFTFSDMDNIDWLLLTEVELCTSGSTDTTNSFTTGITTTDSDVTSTTASTTASTTTSTTTSTTASTMTSTTASTTGSTQANTSASTTANTQSSTTASTQASTTTSTTTSTTPSTTTSTTPSTTTSTQASTTGNTTIDATSNISTNNTVQEENTQAQTDQTAIAIGVVLSLIVIFLAIIIIFIFVIKRRNRKKISETDGICETVIAKPSSPTLPPQSHDNNADYDTSKESPNNIPEIGQSISPLYDRLQPEKEVTKKEDNPETGKQISSLYDNLQPKKKVTKEGDIPGTGKPVPSLYDSLQPKKKVTKEDDIPGTGKPVSSLYDSLQPKKKTTKENSQEDDQTFQPSCKHLNSTMQNQLKQDVRDEVEEKPITYSLGYEDMCEVVQKKKKHIEASDDEQDEQTEYYPEHIYSAVHKKKKKAQVVSKKQGKDVELYPEHVYFAVQKKEKHSQVVVKEQDKDIELYPEHVYSAVQKKKTNKIDKEMIPLDKLNSTELQSSDTPAHDLYKDLYTVACKN